MEINYNSIKNQEIKRKFVEREVYSCVSTMVEYILNQNDHKNAPFTWDDVENYYIDNTEKIEELEEQKEQLEDKLDEVQEELEELKNKEGFTEEKGKKIKELENKVKKLENKIADIEEEIGRLEDKQDEPQAIFEWWIVSDFLCRKLKEYGEVVIKHENIWGRGTTGQAIYLDSIISKICEEMEILEGQNYEWKV